MNIDRAERRVREASEKHLPELEALYERKA